MNGVLSFGSLDVILSLCALGGGAVASYDD